MVKVGFAILALAVQVPTAPPPLFPIGMACRHAADETAEHAMRRANATEFARAINTREAEAKRDHGTYQPLGNLSGLMESRPVIDGFSVWLVTDGTYYMVRLQDQLDRCHFAVFSTNDGRIFVSAPLQQDY